MNKQPDSPARRPITPGAARVQLQAAFQIVVFAVSATRSVLQGAAFRF